MSEPLGRGVCPECDEQCDIVPLDNAIHYNPQPGQSGVHRPAGYGCPVSECCEANMEIEK